MKRSGKSAQSQILRDGPWLPALRLLLSLQGEEGELGPVNYWSYQTVAQFLHLLNESSNLSVGAGYGSTRTFLSVKRVLVDRVLPEISPRTRVSSISLAMGTELPVVKPFLGIARRGQKKLRSSWSCSIHSFIMCPTMPSTDGQHWDVLFSPPWTSGIVERTCALQTDRALGVLAPWCFSYVILNK